MSYCVNCGVELDKTCEQCPLCCTPVFNPNCPVDRESNPPYPKERGFVEPVNRKAVATFLTVVLGAIALACFLLNILLYDEAFWSAYVMGVCLLFWIFTVPVMILQPPIPLTIVLDGAAVAFYCYVIALQFTNRVWYYRLALPIIITLVTLFLIYYSVTKRFRMSILARIAVVFSEIGALNVIIELAVCYLRKVPFRITWSAVVLTCCAIIVVPLVTILRQSQLREELRKRMHI